MIDRARFEALAPNEQNWILLMAIRELLWTFGDKADVYDVMVDAPDGGEQRFGMNGIMERFDKSLADWMDD